MSRISILIVAVLAGVIAAPGCFPAGRPPVPVPQVERRLVIGDPRGPNFVLEASWWRQGDRFCARGPVDVLTPVGPVRLHDADLCATRWPATITGEAQLPLPAIGFLASLVTSTVAPRGRLGLALGRDLGTLAVGSERLPAAPDHYYLSLDGGARHDVVLGRGALTVGDRMILDVHAPVLYFAGDLAGLLPATLRGVALGVAPAGGLLYTSGHELHDGQRSSVRRLDGHLLVQGTVPLGAYPVTVTGALTVDLDADDDGRTLFVDDGDDLALGGDVTARVGYTSAGFNLRLELARASILYERGALYLGAQVPGAVLAGTPLAAFAPRGNLTVLGTYRSAADAILVLRGEGQIAGLPISDAEIQLGSGGVAISGRVNIPALGAVDVSGALTADGGYALRGRGDLTAAGLPITGAEIVLSSTGVQVSGTVHFAGRSFHVAGAVQPGGQYTLTATVPIEISPILGRAQLSLGSSGLSVRFQGRVCVSGVCVQIPETVVDPQGNVCPSFPLVGRRCVKVL